MQPKQRPSRDTFAPALTGSLLLHACLVIGLWQLSASPAAVRIPEEFVSIELRALRELPVRPPAPIEQPEPALEPIELPDRSARELIRQDQPEPAEIADAEAPPDSLSEAEPAPEQLPLVPDEVEFEEVHRDAVARVVDSLQDEFNQPRFVITEDGETVAPAEEDPFGDGIDLDLFERAERLPSNGALTPGRGSSRIGNRVAELCNSLTGGFSLFGIVNVCADPAARADLFGHLRPEYMESVPLCTAEEDLEVDVVQTGSTTVGEMKCVLVPREVRAAIYSRYDPSLAGWLPAEEDESATGSAEITD